MTAMKAAFFISCLFVSVTGRAQITSFKILDNADGNPLEGARVFGLHSPLEYKASGSEGTVLFDISKVDTVVIIKDFYFPVYMTVSHQNFDFSHSIAVKMVHSGQENIAHHTTGIQSLASFEYHFVHDNPGDNSHMKLTYYSHAPEQPAGAAAGDNSFKFTGIPLDRFSVHPHRAGAHSYRLKK